MALDVYFREDILNVLRATYAAAAVPASLLSSLAQDQRLGNAASDGLLEAYRQGFCTALGAVGLAFGVDPSGHRSGLPGHSMPGSEQVESGDDGRRARVSHPGSSTRQVPAFLWPGPSSD